MKTSNLLLLLLSLVLLSGVLITDHLLALQYVKVNLGDPYKNFETVTALPFKALTVTGGNGYAIRVIQGENYSIRVMNSRKAMFTMKTLGDTVSISFSVADQQYQPPEACTAGLIITAPAISYLQLSGTNNEIGPFHQDSMVIQQDKNTVTRLREIRVDNLMIVGSGKSVVEFKLTNAVRNLSLHLKHRAIVNFQQISFERFDPVVEDTASIIFYKQSLDKLLHLVTANGGTNRE